MALGTNDHVPEPGLQVHNAPPQFVRRLPADGAARHGCEPSPIDLLGRSAFSIEHGPVAPADGTVNAEVRRASSVARQYRLTKCAKQRVSGDLGAQLLCTVGEVYRGRSTSTDGDQKRAQVGAPNLEARIGNPSHIRHLQCPNLRN